MLVRLLLLAVTLLFTQPATAQEYDSRTGNPGEVAQQFYRSMTGAAADTVGQRVGPPQGIPASGLLGRSAGDQFGSAVSSAGDVNGDGFADVIVGAEGNDANGSDAGAAYIYFGGPLMDTAADVTLAGQAVGDGFGSAVSSAGDINGDGYADIIVGAFGNDMNGSSAGAAYVYFGGTLLDAVADMTLTGQAAGDLFGGAVSSAGDVNGDGYADVIVGANGDDTSGLDAGAAFVFFGGSSVDAVADVALTGEAAGDSFGGVLSSAGDVNGDGFADVIVGAPGNDTSGSSSGAAYVYFGGASMDTVADVTVTGEAGFDLLGLSVSSAGDINGDGYADVVAGAPGNDVTGSNAGAAYVYFGGASVDAIADVIMRGEAINDQFGTSVSSAGDANGDGLADIVVGAFGNDEAGSGAGAAYVYFGGASMDAVADVKVTGQTAGELSGRSVSSAGDVDGDGLADIVVGAEANSVNGSSAGAAYLYSFSMTGLDLLDTQVIGQAALDQFGGSVSSAGDVNGDGYADIIVGAPRNDANGSDAGAAYVYFGGPSMGATADVTLTGQAAGDQFGSAVSSAGDVNGDGYADVIVGALSNDAAGSGAGAAYVYFGGPSMDATADVTLLGQAAGELLGSSVSSAGDVNGDGFADVVVGALGNDAGGVNTGAAYVYFGGPSMDATADVTLLGQAAGDLFGEAVSSAGDVNGDGYADVIVGAPRNDAGGSNAGAARVYFGGPSMDATADVTLLGQAGTNFFGESVSSAGDVNSDGFADVLISAPQNGAGGNNAGAAYVYFGGPSMGATADVTLLGQAAGDLFGEAVSSAGDVNGDGYADVIVGAIFEDTNGSDAGAAYVYFGGASMDAVADVTMRGQAAGDEFGASVSSAGDVNGDGLADVIVGANFDDNVNGENAGAAYVYESTVPAVHPGIYAVADVAGDQGGAVTVKWTRSGYDAPGYTGGDVSEYLVERSEPPGTVGFAWEPVATVAATENPRYLTTAATFSDQTENNPGTTYFRVTAFGADGEIWRSAVASGASIDNLAPAAPAMLSLAESGDGDVLLTWTPNDTDPDVFGYRVYETSAPAARSATATEAVLSAASSACDLTSATPLATAEGDATDAFEVDAVAFGTDTFLCLTTVDVHGNESAPTEVVSANPTVLAALKVILAGAYQAGLPGGALMRTAIEDDLPLVQPYAGAPWNYAGTESIPATDADTNGRPDLLDTYEVVDWVLVCLRTSPTGTEDGCAAVLLLADGTLLDPSTEAEAARVGPVVEAAYYVAVYHRTSLSAMTAFAVGLSAAQPGADYDLTASPSFVFGGAGAQQTLATGVYGLWAGDANLDGQVTAPDFNAWSAATAAGATGYDAADFNLDGQVTAPDFNLWSAATAAGATTEVPVAPGGPWSAVQTVRPEQALTPQR